MVLITETILEGFMNNFVEVCKIPLVKIKKHRKLWLYFFNYCSQNIHFFQLASEFFKNLDEKSNMESMFFMYTGMKILTI